MSTVALEATAGIAPVPVAESGAVGHGMIRIVSNQSSGPRRPPLLWEQHCCLPLERHADVGELARYRRPGAALFR